MQYRIENLISSVGTTDFEMLERVAREIVEIGQPAIDPLYNIMQDRNKDFFMRQRCAYALVKIGKPTVDRFIAGLKDEDAVIRHLSAWALGKLKYPQAVEPLIAVIEDTTPRDTTFALMFGKKEPIDNSKH
ncbi:MAG: HEAT repeat domain-containing protein [Nitrospirae bacterium]|nr:HEAT repeat domain-containing protein [Nitrospirota bacterium]